MSKTEQQSAGAVEIAGSLEAVSVAGTSGAVERDVPPIPGGGSWRFDEAAWEWIKPAAAVESDARA